MHHVVLDLMFRDLSISRSCSLSLLASRKYSSSSSVLLRLFDVLVCLSVCLLVTPCAMSSWHSMSCLVANCSLAVQRGLLDVTAAFSRKSPSCSGPLSLRG